MSTASLPPSLLLGFILRSLSRAMWMATNAMLLPIPVRGAILMPLGAFVITLAVLPKG